MHIPEARARQPRRTSGLTSLEQINALESERQQIWARSCSQPTDRQRLAEISTQLSRLWAERRQEQAQS